MFLLNELPSPQALKKFKKRFSNMDELKTITALEMMKAASLTLMRLEDYFRENGLSQSKFLSLMVIERSENSKLTHNEISMALGISKKNTTRLLQNMERLNLINRYDHDSDARIKWFKVTKNGQNILNELLPGYYNIINISMEDIDDKEMRQLGKSFQKIISNSIQF